MPGRIIDRAALTGLGAAGFYLFFLNTGLAIPASCLLAFACMALLRGVVARRPRRYRASREDAETALWRVCRMPEAEAIDALRALSGEAEAIPLIRHPEAQLSRGEVFALWRAHLGEDGLVIAATCGSAPEVASMLEGLTGPRIRVFDRGDLVKAIRATGQYVLPAPGPTPLRRRLARALPRLLRRPLGPKVALYGLSLVLMYLLTGRTACLAAGLMLVGFTGVSWIRRFAPSA